MLAIFERELKSYFTSMTAYIYLALFMVIVGYLYVYCCVGYGMNDFGYYVLSNGTILFFLLPVITMRLFSAERKNRVDQLIMTAPVKSVDIVFGKFLAVFTLFLISTACSVIYPVLIAIFGKVNMKELLCGYLGFILLGLCFLSIGLFVSAVTDNQIVAVIVTLAIYIVLIYGNSILSMIPSGKIYTFIMFGVVIVAVAVLFAIETKKWVPSAVCVVVGVIGTGVAYLINGDWFDSGLATVLKDISIYGRYQDFGSNLIDISTIVFLLSFTFVFLMLTTQTIRARRWR